MIKKICDKCGFSETDIMSTDNFDNREESFYFTEGKQIKRAEVLLCKKCKNEYEEELEKILKEQSQKFKDSFFTEETKTRAIKKWADYEKTFRDFGSAEEYDFGGEEDDE